MNERVCNIRKELSGFIEHEKGNKLRNELHTIAMNTYQPRNSSNMYLDFMNNNECSFSVNGSQSINHPYYFTMFSIVSQHVMGDCIEECLDKALAIRDSKYIGD